MPFVPGITDRFGWPGFVSAFPTRRTVRCAAAGTASWLARTAVATFIKCNPPRNNTKPITTKGPAEKTRFADANKNLTSALDKAVKSAPAGSDVAVAAVKSALAAANQAYDAFSKASKQVAEATEATMTAAGTATKKKAA